MNGEMIDATTGIQGVNQISTTLSVPSTIKTDSRSQIKKKKKKASTFRSSSHSSRLCRFQHQTDPYHFWFTSRDIASPLSRHSWHHEDFHVHFASSMRWNSSQAPDSFTKERFGLTIRQQLANKMPTARYKIPMCFASRHLCWTRYVWVPKYTSDPSKGAVNASFKLTKFSNLTKWQGIQQKRFQQCPECLIVLQRWNAAFTLGFTREKTNHKALTEWRILNKSLNIVQTARSASKRCLVHASNSTQQIYGHDIPTQAMQPTHKTWGFQHGKLMTHKVTQRSSFFDVIGMSQIFANHRSFNELKSLSTTVILLRL